MSAASSATQRRRRAQILIAWLVSFAIFGLAAFMIISEWSNFQKSLEALRSANIWWGVGAFVCITVAIAGGALVYSAIALRRATYSSLLLVSWAGMFINRLLPAGAGGIGLFMDYFLRRGHKTFEASGVIALSSILTFAGHAGLIALITLTGLSSLEGAIHMPPWLPVVLGCLIALIVLSLVLLRGQLRARVIRWRRELERPFKRLASKPWHFLVAQTGALLNTLGHAGALYIAMLACGVDISFADAIIVLAGGVVAATLSPTPGGLVGAEAGLAGAMLLYGAAPVDALAAALLYRLVSYWIPLFFGVIALVLSRRKGYI